jgi:glycosyltransferase involved in cell wall biosynthesis
MKLLVLAHTPPPFHGQSYMVQILLDCFHPQVRSQTSGPDSQDQVVAGAPIECIHVDMRLSTSIDDIGQRPWAKLGLTLRYAIQAVINRFRYGASTLFYIPAPALTHAIYRDWLVMLICRPFFQRTVFWWQAAGLGRWLQEQAKPWQRQLTLLLLSNPSLSVVMGTETEHDAKALRSRRIAVIPNAIPDPCPDAASEVVAAKARHRESLRRRMVQEGETASAPGIGIFRLLFISLCYREKGLFDALEAVALMNQRLCALHCPVRVQLDVAGRFYLPSEQKEFEERIRQPDLQRVVTAPGAKASDDLSSTAAVQYHGFAAGDAKSRLFRECDCLIFPTYYAAESFGLVVLEAMAHGMDIITTRWRNIPELLPAHYRGLVEPRDPQALARVIELFLHENQGPALRKHFEDHHHIRHFQRRMRQALQDLTRPAYPAPNPAPR